MAIAGIMKQRVQAIDAVDAEGHQDQFAGGVRACTDEQADAEFAAHAFQGQFGGGTLLDEIGKAKIYREAGDGQHDDVLNRL